MGSEGRKSVTAASRPKVLKVTSRLWRLTPSTAHAVPLPLQTGGGKIMDGACKARQSCRAAAHFPMVCMREIRDGRSTTTKMAGKMQNTRGKTIFTGAFIAWVLAL